MLKGTELGQAIKQAIELKGVKQADVADYFGVRAPAVSSWIKTGKISRENTEKLLTYFSDVVEPSHFGMDKISMSHNNQEYDLTNLKDIYHYLYSNNTNDDPTHIMSDQSLSPIIPEGSLLWVDGSKQDIINGKIYLMEYDGMKWFRRLFRLPDNQIQMRVFDNQDFAEYIVSLDKINIIGRVTAWKVIEK